MQVLSALPTSCTLLAKLFFSWLNFESFRSLIILLSILCRDGIMAPLDALSVCSNFVLQVSWSMASGTLRCTSPNHGQKRMPSDDNPTHSYKEQHKVEDSTGNCYLFFKTQLRDSLDLNLPQLHRIRHESFLLKGIFCLKWNQKLQQ